MFIVATLVLAAAILSCRAAMPGNDRLLVCGILAIFALIAFLSIGRLTGSTSRQKSTGIKAWLESADCYLRLSTNERLVQVAFPPFSGQGLPSTTGRSGITWAVPLRPIRTAID
jgi:hypothetical protein